ncbi:tetratricopeptide (TPR) repeat protein [Parvibaculum indicum]|uniref:tetratricopeptide repeat protein n=1 Tax=Parvibaculum indicum TaxID=562969 RepID=UPI00141EA3BA|nr:tetratricopeptide repeat protein [Parvibaculum indicum]NIJ41721.1 tetratricopeptide (TPR) repeat protein [Parvibaculum indicum]
MMLKREARGGNRHSARGRARLLSRPGHAVARLALFGGLALALSGCAGLAPSLGLGDDDVIRTESAYGAYLAGRHAAAQSDSDTAAAYFDQALKAAPTDPVVLQRAFTASLVASDETRAVRLARKLVAQTPDDRLAGLVLALDAVKRGHYDDPVVAQAQSDNGPFSALVGTLTGAWAEAGKGDRAAALEKLAAFEGRTAYDLFRSFHKALILDYLDDAKGANDAFAAAMTATGGGSIRVVQAYASFLQRNGHADDAATLFGQFAKLAPDNPLVKDALRRLAADEALPRVAATPAAGVAEVLYGLGSALDQGATRQLAQLYIHLALFMKPDFDVARTVLGGLYEDQERWQIAIDQYSEVPEDSALYLSAQIQTGIDLNRLGREEEATALLRDLVEEHPRQVDPLVALGDIYRSKEDYASAEAEYEKAIALVETPSRSDWTLYYARGICNERLGNWDQAEKDLKLALKLSDGNALVLNYLGYSWVEQGEHLSEAFDMIEKAVEQRPDDGYIVDSLGWAHYRLGDYGEAVKYLERAVELEPGDPTINEHLGDALWKVGRRIEAGFQWGHALELDPDKKRIPLLKDKLEYGLEQAEKRNDVGALLDTGAPGQSTGA